jgi:hypothetical protein
VRRILIGAGGLALAAAAAWGIRVGVPKLVAHPALAVREVTVRGAETVAAEEVLRLAAIPSGSPWLAVDTRAVRFRLHALPAVHEVHVRRPWIGKICLDVRECPARARVVIAGEEYGVCDHLQIVPAPDEDRDALPLIRTGRGPVDPGELARGMAYLEQIRRRGLADGESIELVLGSDGRDRIRFPDRGFAAAMARPIPPPDAIRDVAAFLEKLDAPGAARGTLRLLSEGTAVWSARA